MNWALMRPRTPTASANRVMASTMSPWSAADSRCGGNTATESPEWTPARSTCSMSPGMSTSRAVAHRVHVDLETLEIGVDAHRPVVIDRGRERQLAGQVLRPVAELDGQAADDEARPHDDRVAHPVGDRDGLLDGGGHAALRLGDAQPVDEAREARPLLGQVDGLE